MLEWNGTRVRGNQTTALTHLAHHRQQPHTARLKTNHLYLKVHKTSDCLAADSRLLSLLQFLASVSSAFERYYHHYQDLRGGCLSGRRTAHKLTSNFHTAELGIDITGILQRSTCIASSRTRNLNLDELDMGGPLIFVLLLACIHLLVSRPAAVIIWPDAVQIQYCPTLFV